MPHRIAPASRGLVPTQAIRKLASFIYSPAGSFLLILIFCISTIFLPVYLGIDHANMDMRAYLSFANEVAHTVASGTLLPSWSNEFAGLGSLAIRLYPPLSSYVTAFIQAFTADWYFTVLIYYFGWMAVGCWGCYLFVAAYADRKYALLAGLLAAIAPFPLAEIYQFNVYAQFAAGSVVPFCFYFCTRVITYQEWKDVLWLSIALSFVLLTHIPTAIFTGLTLSAYSIFLIVQTTSWRAIVMLFSASFLSLSATAFYWFRLVTELDWVAHNGSEYRSGIYSYTHWLFPSSISADMTVLMFLYRRIDVLVLIQVALLIPSLLVLFLKGLSYLRKRPVIFGLSACSLLALLMISKPSAIVWEHFDVLQKTQFPWRWLAVITPLSIIAFVIGIAELRFLRPDRKGLWTFGTLLAISLFLMYDIRLNFREPSGTSKIDFEQNFAPEKSPLGSEHQMWWPVWAKTEALNGAGQIKADDRLIDTYQWSTSERHFLVGPGQPTDVRIPTFYYPYWKAVVNGNSVEVRRDELGLILVPVGADRSDVQLVFEEPLKNRIAVILSAGAWAVILVTGTWLLLSGWRRRKLKSVDRHKNSGSPTNDSC